MPWLRRWQTRCKKKTDLARVIEKALALDGVSGAVAILGDDLAAGGDLELVEI
jgi:hypothetical protein